MTDPTDAELNELADDLTPNTETGSLNYQKFARAVLAKWGPPAHSGEPIAWMRDWDVYDPTNSGPEFSHTKKERSKGWDPLYTAPQPVERDPLTADEQDGLYWRLHSLSKSLEGRGRIDEYDTPDAYRTILEAMNALRDKKGGQHGDTKP